MAEFLSRALKAWITTSAAERPFDIPNYKKMEIQSLEELEAKSKCFRLLSLETVPVDKVQRMLEEGRIKLQAEDYARLHSRYGPEECSQEEFNFQHEQKVLQFHARDQQRLADHHGLALKLPPGPPKDRGEVSMNTTSSGLGDSLELQDLRIVMIVGEPWRRMVNQC